MSEQRKQWARKYIAAAPDSPTYGTTEWLRLPDGPEKISAVVRAAECWATDGDTLNERLRNEIDDLRLAHKQGEDAEYAHRRDEHSREWSGKSWRPHPANRRTESAVMCPVCGTPTSPWTCSCGQTRVGEVA